MSKILIFDLNDEKSHLFRQIVENEWPDTVFTEISDYNSGFSECWLIVCNRFTNTFLEEKFLKYLF